MERERHGRDDWQEQLSEYWDSGLTIDVGISIGLTALFLHLFDLVCLFYIEVIFLLLFC